MRVRFNLPDEPRPRSPPTFGRGSRNNQPDSRIEQPSDVVQDKVIPYHLSRLLADRVKQNSSHQQRLSPEIVASKKDDIDERSTSSINPATQMACKNETRSRISTLESRCTNLERIVRDLLDELRDEKVHGTMPLSGTDETIDAQQDRTQEADLTSLNGDMRPTEFTQTGQRSRASRASMDEKRRYGDLPIDGTAKLRLKSPGGAPMGYPIKSYWWHHRWYLVQGDEDPAWLTHTKEERLISYHKLMKNDT